MPSEATISAGIDVGMAWLPATPRPCATRNPMTSTEKATKPSTPRQSGRPQEAMKP